ncbi:MAG TPA: haloacid dehalogenase type II [Aliidongia sp.]|nr:haloacid dehalogenase type II [Aliidongia sp.]
MRDFTVGNIITRRALLAAAAATLPLAIPLATAQSARPADGFDPAKVKALTFDIQGTTVDYYQPLLRMGEAVNRQKGLSLDWGKISSEWRDRYHDVIDAILAGKRPWMPTEQVYRQGLDVLLEQHGIADKFSEAERADMAAVWGRMVPWPDSVEGVGRLKRRYTVATLSNAGMATVLAIVKNGGIPFDTVLTGELAHSFKPSPSVYQLGVDYLGFRPDQIMMVACHKYDLKAAKAFGFWTAFLPRPLEYGPGVQISTSPEEFIDVMAADLVDLAARMGT